MRPPPESAESATPAEPAESATPAPKTVRAKGKAKGKARIMKVKKIVVVKRPPKDGGQALVKKELNLPTPTPPKPPPVKATAKPPLPKPPPAKSAGETSDPPISYPAAKAKWRRSLRTHNDDRMTGKRGTYNVPMPDEVFAAISNDADAAAV